MTENISTSKETDNIEISPELLCPICNEIYVYPRNYDCGHTLCQLCMIKMDDIDREKCQTHLAPKHSCPLCRKTTIKAWYDRPINISLQNLARKNKKYRERKKEVEKHTKEKDIIEIPEKINLSVLSWENRNYIAEDTYKNILPILYTAAASGLNYVIIDEIETVKQIEKSIDILSKILFEKNNVYRILVTRKECTIYLTKNAFRYRREYLNGNYVGPEVENNSISAENSNEDILIRRLAETYVNALSSPIRNPLRHPLPPPTP